MNLEQARRFTALHAEATKVKRHFDEWVLLSLDGHSKEEVINVGDPIQFKQGQYHRMTVKIPDEVRRIAFRAWRKALAIQFNEYVRKMNQLGGKHEFSLIEFNRSTGDPL